MELLSNLVQLAATVLGFCLAGAWYRRTRGQAWFLLTCFYGCFALGALYWTLYLLLFDRCSTCRSSGGYPARCSC